MNNALSGSDGGGRDPRDPEDLALSRLLADPGERRSAFDRLIALYTGMLGNYARSLPGVSRDDMVQGVALKAWISLDTFRPGSLFRPWLCTVAFSVVCDWARREKRQRELREQWVRVKLQQAAAANGKACWEDVAEYLSRLDPGDRELLELRFLDGRTLSELADHFKIMPGCNANTRISAVNRRLNKVIEQLRLNAEGR